MASRATLAAMLAAVTCAMPCDLPPQPSHEDIANFSSSGCTVVSGDLHLGSICTQKNLCSDASSSLEGAVDLGTITTITGSLTCWGCSNITNVTAPSLREVAAVAVSRTEVGIDRVYNEELTGLYFPVLRNILGNVMILHNDVLTDLDMGAVERIEGDLHISYHLVLAEVDTRALLSIGGYLEFQYNSLLAATGMKALQSIQGFMHIENNDALAALGMADLSSIGGYVRVEENVALAAVEMGALRSIGFNVQVEYNEVLARMDLGSLQSVTGDLYIKDNEALTFMDIGSLQSVTGDLVVKGINGTLTFAVNACFNSSVFAGDGVEIDVLSTSVEGCSVSPTSSPTSRTQLIGRKVSSSRRTCAAYCGARKCLGAWEDNFNSCVNYKAKETCSTDIKSKYPGTSDMCCLCEGDSGGEGKGGQGKGGKGKSYPRGFLPTDVSPTVTLSAGSLVGTSSVLLCIFPLSSLLLT